MNAESTSHDPDRQETSEWLEAMRAVRMADGAERESYLLNRLMKQYASGNGEAAARFIAYLATLLGDMRRVLLSVRLPHSAGRKAAPIHTDPLPKPDRVKKACASDPMKRMRRDQGLATDAQAASLHELGHPGGIE